MGYLGIIFTFTLKTTNDKDGQMAIFFTKVKQH